MKDDKAGAEAEAEVEVVPLQRYKFYQVAEDGTVVCQHTGQCKISMPPQVHYKFIGSKRLEGKKFFGGGCMYLYGDMLSCMVVKGAMFLVQPF